MKKPLVSLLLLLLLAGFHSPAQQHSGKEDPSVLLFSTDSLLSELRTADSPWLAFLRGENVLTGMYFLKQGETDPQSPHDTDEVYYIIQGKATFKADGKEMAVGRGSVIFVRAGVAHRFTAIEEDLEVLVFFDQ